MKRSATDTSLSDLMKALVVHRGLGQRQSDAVAPREAAVEAADRVIAAVSELRQASIRTA